MIQTNVGTIDRTLRIAVGATLVILTVTGQILVPMATGLLRWCPAYLPFGLSTCKTR